MFGRDPNCTVIYPTSIAIVTPVALDSEIPFQLRIAILTRIITCASQPNIMPPISTSSHSQAVAHPSATVVVVRDSPDGLETLLLKRHKDIRFAGGDWVFPGGKIEPAELDRYADIEQAERHAAVRECAEESGIDLDVAQLQKFAHWITPEAMPRRFSTGFYIVAVEQNISVEIDRGEIVEYQWLAPCEALARQKSGELSMMPPTFVSLCELANMNSAAGAIKAFASRDAIIFLPKIIRSKSEVCILYEGDSGYLTGDPASAAVRHRLVMGEAGYRYVRD